MLQNLFFNGNHLITQLAVYISHIRGILPWFAAIWCLNWPKDGRVHRWLASASADVLASAMLGRWAWTGCVIPKQIYGSVGWRGQDPSRPHSQVKTVKGFTQTVLSDLLWFTDVCWCNEGLQSFYIIIYSTRKACVHVMFGVWVALHGCFELSGGTLASCSVVCSKTLMATVPWL